MASDIKVRWTAMAATAGLSISLLPPALASAPKVIESTAKTAAASRTPVVPCEADMRFGPVECAEWKSANAAESAADAARESVEISRWTLGAAIVAGIAAVVAACFARASNRIARSVGQAQARCYLSAPRALVRINDLGQVTVKCVAHNSGQSPARIPKWTFTVRVQNDHDDWTWERTAADDLPGADVSALGEEELSATLTGEDIMPIDQASDLLLGPSVAVRLTVSARWIDVFDIAASDRWSFAATLPGLLNQDLPLERMPGGTENA